MEKKVRLSLLILKMKETGELIVPNVVLWQRYVLMMAMSEQLIITINILFFVKVADIMIKILNMGDHHFQMIVGLNVPGAGYQVRYI